MNTEKPLITLAVITGNEAQHVRRFLDCFKPEVDEVVMVRAIGNQAPDATLDIARDEYGCRVYEYTNALAHADWPHVDDFGRARQMSFDHARGEFVMWADLDDVLEPQFQGMFRKLATANRFDWYECNYEIEGNNNVTKRERMIRNGCGAWSNPVHEIIKKFPGVRGVFVENIQINHRPLAGKPRSNTRNLRILDAVPDRNGDADYYFHCELLASGNVKRAVEVGLEAVTKKQMHRDPEYKTCLNVARFCGDKDLQLNLLMRAMALWPERRDAWAMLSSSFGDWNEPIKALAFARGMLAQPVPSVMERGTTFAPSFYEWQGPDTYLQALRLNDPEAAEKAAQLMRADVPARMTVCHLPQNFPNAVETRRLWFERAAQNMTVEHVFIVHPNNAGLARMLRRFRVVVDEDPAVAALKAATTDLLVLAKDLVFPPQHGWDDEMAAVFKDITLPGAVDCPWEIGALAACNRKFLEASKQWPVKTRPA